MFAALRRSQFAARGFWSSMPRSTFIPSEADILSSAGRAAIAAGKPAASFPMPLIVWQKDLAASETCALATEWKSPNVDNSKQRESGSQNLWRECFPVIVLGVIRKCMKVRPVWGNLVKARLSKLIRAKQVGHGAKVRCRKLVTVTLAAGNLPPKRLPPKRLPASALKPSILKAASVVIARVKRLKLPSRFVLLGTANCDLDAQRLGHGCLG